MNPATLWNHQIAPETVSGDSGDLPAATQSELAFDVTVSDIEGDGASILFAVERKGVDGEYYPLWSSSSITEAGAASQTIGAGLETSKSFGHAVRVAWTISDGATATFSGGLLAK